MSDLWPPAGYVAHSKLLCVHDPVHASGHWLRARPLCTCCVEVSQEPCPWDATACGLLRSAEKRVTDPGRHSLPARLCRCSLMRVRGRQKLLPAPAHDVHTDCPRGNVILRNAPSSREADSLWSLITQDSEKAESSSISSLPMHGQHLEI